MTERTGRERGQHASTCSVGAVRSGRCGPARWVGGGSGVALCVALVCAGGWGGAARAQGAAPDGTLGGAAGLLPAALPTLIFPKVRGLGLGAVRAMALKQSTSIALAQSKLGQARAELRDQENRFKVNTQGGLDPFSGKVRFYLALDLERLLQLNTQQRAVARQAVEAQSIGQTDAQNTTLKGVTVAWFGLQRAEASVLSAARYRETSNAIYVAADARFKAGEGELTGVLSGLRGTWESEDAYSRARQDVALACLDLAQACGYSTAEEMEAALP